MSTLTIDARPTLWLTIKRLVVRHPFLTFFTLAFAGTWLLDLPMVLGKDGLGLLPYQVPFGLYVALFLLGSYAGPTLAAFFVTGVLEGKAGVKHFLRRFVQWRVGWRWYLLILAGYPLIFLGIASFWLGMAPVAAVGRQWSTFFAVYLPALLIFPAFINWGEEIGWRGFAQTGMQAEYGALRSCLVIGLLHGIWHLPVFLMVVGPPAMGPFAPWRFLFNTFSIVMITIIWTWVFNRAQGSILMAALLHTTYNAAQGWINTLLPHLPNQVMYTALGFFWVAALLLILVTKGRLGYEPPRHTRDKSIE